MKRSGFKTKLPARPQNERAAEFATFEPRPRQPAQPLRVDDGAARAVVPVPKTAYVRSKPLREAYRLLPCQFDREGGGLCGLMDGTVCCAHSNWSVHGKGGRIKASDDRGASACARHHAELDQGSAWPQEVRQARWWDAHVRSIRLLVLLGAWPEGIQVPQTHINPFEEEDP